MNEPAVRVAEGSAPAGPEAVVKENYCGASAQRLAVAAAEPKE